MSSSTGRSRLVADRASPAPPGRQRLARRLLQILLLVIVQAMPAHAHGGVILVLGDNAPLSNDSRHWKEPGLDHNLLIGKVLPPRH